MSDRKILDYSVLVDLGIVCDVGQVLDTIFHLRQTLPNLWSDSEVPVLICLRSFILCISSALFAHG